MSEKKIFYIGLELSVRSSNCLLFGGVETLKKLLNHTKQDLFKHRNIGEKTADEIINELKSVGLDLKKNTCPYCGSNNTDTKYSMNADALWKCGDCLRKFYVKLND